MIRKLRAPAVVTTLALVTVLAAGVGQSDASRTMTLAPTATLKRLATVNASAAQAVAVARSSDGKLHLVYQTFSGRSFSGLASTSISAAGAVGPEIQALAGWQAGQPGLVALPGGQLEAFFGSISPDFVSSVWGITSSDGGATWSAPTDVRGGGPNEPLAYGSDVTAAVTGGTSVLMLPQAGNIVVQTGLGNGSPSFQVTNANDGATTDADVVTDAATGAVVASWPSIAHDPALYMQSVAPTLGAAQHVPGQSRNALVLAARDAGAGVFGAYTPDGTHVRLLRYGGGSVAVGSLAGTSAKALGVATGIAGRIWVMWGDDAGGGIAFTRSNKAVTRFEPIQHVPASIASIYRLSGDGRLGPLDLLVDEIPGGNQVVPAGLYYARVLPVLTASVSVTPVKNTMGVVIAHTLTVSVTDAGDAVAGATVSAGSKKKKTSGSGVAKLTLPGSGGSVTLVVTSPGYAALSETVHL